MFRLAVVGVVSVTGLLVRERYEGPDVQVPACPSGLHTEPEILTQEDYELPSYVTDTVDLYFHLDDLDTQVRAEYSVNSINASRDLVLFGSDNFDLLLLEANGKSLFDGEENDWNLCVNTDNSLVVKAGVLPDDDDGAWNLTIIVKSNPTANKALFGLYKSEDLLITQNEAHGFRRIIYSFDRPDVQSVFTTTLDGSTGKYPVLLANGNMVQREERDNGKRHIALFSDPSRKPTYLFAAVAGPLEGISADYELGRPCEDAVRDFYLPYSFASGRTVESDDFNPAEVDLYKYCAAFPPSATQSSRNVKITVWGMPGRTDRLQWALASVEKAMLWDEIRFGRYYDLDEFHVVATSYFNAGAMENKGLNIFNDALILASPVLSTDSQLERIQGVIAHEYFHNWSGDRVTVRDWLQLTLKEGFTVFRDQEFTADITRSSVKRLADSELMELVQFEQDRSALSHPIRPKQIQSVENLYTVTVYEKGAEIIRMYETILGWKDFRVGCNLYFLLNDGKSSTCEDFLAAMEGASDLDLSQFMRWYSVKGTPRVTAVEKHYSSDTKTYRFTLSQASNSEEPLWIPVRAALVSRTTPGKLLSEELVFHLREESEEFEFDNVEEDGVLSLLRGFSAPVELDARLSPSDLKRLAKFDTDAYSRWKALERLYQRAILSVYQDQTDGMDDAREVFSHLLHEAEAGDESYWENLAIMLTMPMSKSIESVLLPFKPLEVFEAVRKLRTQFYDENRETLSRLIRKLIELGEGGLEDYQYNPRAKGIRALRNTLIGVVVHQNHLNDDVVKLLQRLTSWFDSATDQASLLNFVSDLPPSSERDELLKVFWDKAKDEDLLVDRWLRAQARSQASDVLARVSFLAEQPVYKNATNPNRLRALMRTFAANPIGFHDKTGKGYDLVVREILNWDTFNPKVAAQLATSFGSIYTWDEEYQVRALKALEKLDLKAVSKNVREVVGKCLSSVDPKLLSDEQRAAGASKDEL